MIYGLWIFPEMGVKGAAWATLIARSFAALYGMYYLLSDKADLKLRFKHFKFKWSLIVDILRVGIPASLSQSMMSLGIMLMTKFVATFGVFAIAAFGIVGRLDSVAVLPIIGINAAVITIVGYNVGAKRFKRAEKTTWVAVGLALLFGTSIGVLFFIFPRWIISFFTNDSAVIEIAVVYLRILALFSGYSAIQIVISGAFQGSGHAGPSLVVMAIRLFALMLPFAYIFGIYMGLGMNYIWWAFPFSGFLSSTIAMIWFKIGTWKKECKVEDGVTVCDPVHPSS
jgi:putative MATE family efflux protein